jgi:hypothetical protein
MTGFKDRLCECDEDPLGYIKALSLTISVRYLFILPYRTGSS